MRRLVVAENTLLKYSCFFFTLEKIKYRSNLASSSDFALTSRGMIIHTGNSTFPIAIMSVFRTKLYMQHLRSLFWFLLSILSILSLTGFPLISVGSQISAAQPSYKHLTFKYSLYYEPVHYLTVTKIKCIWGKYIYNEAIQITSSGICQINIYHNDCYLRLFVIKFHITLLFLK